MTAHNPITAGQALAIMEAIGVTDARQLIADRTAAGLVKSYALMIETAAVDGPRQSVRDATIARELWRRMIREGATEDIWGGGTVRLKAAEFIGGAPEVHITGIAFHPAHIQQLADQQRSQPVSATRTQRAPAEAVAVVGDAAAEPVSAERAVPDPAAIPPGAILCTIKQAGDALGIKRTTVTKLIGQGKLVRQKLGAASRITVESVQAYAGVTS